MIIRKIRMVNFRGFRDKTIDFDGKSVVLLSAANGVGKTTTIDAIEWCLTGNIGRLKTAFDTRSTNDADRKINTDGILKNRDAGTRERVRVVLWLVDGEKETILCREQTSDELNPRVSKVTIDENEEIAKQFIREYVGDSFYNFHFCDVQKSFNVQSKKRKDMKDFFGEFITNYDEQKQIAENLDIFAVDVDRYIEDKSKQKVSQEVIKTHEEQLAKARKDAKQISYPEIIFYLDETTEIASLNKEELTEQKAEVENCGYQVAKEVISKLVENEALKSQQSVIKEIASYWETKGESISRAVKAGFSKNTDAITTLEIKFRKLKSLSLSKDTILQDGESVIALDNEGFTQSDFDADKKAINEKEKKVKELSDEIELLSKNNKMLKLLSSLSANKQVVIEHRDTAFKENGAVRCPVCGSESFATMEEKLILNLDAEIEELQKLKDIASQRAKDIRDIVEKLSKDEYEKVGPTLGKFYNKLTRINSSYGINIVQENEGISLVDDKGKNIVNILSNGQISVFMLAHFFAGINARNDREKMKVYFIDDLTACMDDVNMLVFMDLLKYQMSSKATMEQLFFITCDDRISNLLKYKLSGREIELCELLEADLV